MDRFLGRQIEAIARDQSSGARELALCAVSALQSWLRRRGEPGDMELSETARYLLRAQPQMAPILRIANLVAFAADSKNPGAALCRSLRNFQAILRSGASQIGERFFRSFRPGARRTLATYSYSSTAVSAIRRARVRVGCVFCSEGRPGMEGRKTAVEISRAGIGVRLVTDAALPGYMASASGLVVGADCICERGFVNKVGTAALAACALEQNKPVWVLADSTKLLPPSLDDVPPRFGSDRDVWAGHPRKITVLNPYFERTPYRRGMRILTERGWMTPGQVEREVRRIPVSSGWGELDD